ncbi:MAG: acetyl-CoA carboxylase biotin carboxyl carrier protein subunit [Bdellovibrionales bacterium]|nr:acetyl-CoA carboxylase biotin carboxyl carrier protein subunit [Bdellovibrionales bacterium]
MTEGKVGSRAIQWKVAPKGKSGEAVLVDSKGQEQTIRYHRDEQGIWIETVRGFFGFDARRFVSDDAQPSYTLVRRKHADIAGGLQFLRAGEASAGVAAKVKKGAKIKSQMPGKIVRINAKVGDSVKKGDRLLVMEAMKMENEIKSPQDGLIKEIKVTEGQAVETGAELLKFE